MKKYTDLLIENAENLNSHDGILVIVDVQDTFSKFIPKNYENKLAEYCKTFKSVYQIWDSNKVKNYSYIFPNQVKSVRKNYGTKFSNDLVEITNKLTQENPNVQEGQVFKLKNNTYVVKVNNNHKWFYVNEDLVNLFRELKGKKVILVGGAARECIFDVFVAMKSFGIFVTQNSEYMYSAKTNDQQIVY